MAFPESDRRRWLQELRGAAEALEEWRVVSESPPVIEGALQTHDGPRRCRIAWPPEFPFRPPSIWELSSTGTTVVDYRHTGHAFTDGSVCLFGHTPESGWRPEFTAGLAITRLRQFIEAADRSVFPHVDAVPIELPLVRVSIHPRLMAQIRHGAGWGLMSGFVRPDGKLVVVAGAEVTTPGGITTGKVSEAPAQAWGQALALFGQWSGLWCRVDAALGDEPPSRARLAEWLNSKVLPTARGAILGQPFVLLVGDDAAWFVWLNPPAEVAAALAPGGRRALYSVPIEEDIPAKLFARADARLDQATILRATRVAVVGLGSLGGSIAVALAKAGVGRFTLFDPDVLEPENLVRHVGCVMDLGIPKVEAVRRAIHRTNPDAAVTLVPSALSLDPAGWNTDAMAKLREVLTDPHGLVVCATATTDAESVVNALCVAARVPAVFAAVLGRAEHGRVFRVLPGESACYQCVLMNQQSDPERFPRFSDADVGAPAYTQPGIPGLGMDVDAVAILAARLALQTIATRIDGGLGYPPAHGDHIIWSARGGWAVDGPLQTRVERMPKHPACPVCGTVSGAALDPTEESELAALLGHASKSEISCPPTGRVPRAPHQQPGPSLR